MAERQESGRSIVRTPAYRAARDAWHAHYCGEDRGCTAADHCAGAPDMEPLRARAELTDALAALITEGVTQ